MESDDESTGDSSDETTSDEKPIEDEIADLLTERTWTDAQGRKIRAKLVPDENMGSEISLLKDGKVFKVPREKLSPEDITYVDEMMERIARVRQQRVEHPTAESKPESRPKKKSPFPTWQPPGYGSNRTDGDAPAHSATAQAEPDQPPKSSNTETPRSNSHSPFSEPPVSTPIQESPSRRMTFPSSRPVVPPRTSYEPSPVRRSNTFGSMGPQKGIPGGWFLLFYVFPYVFCFMVIALLAARKNRNGFAWGFFGGFFLVLTAIVLMFMPFLCPRCKRPLTNREWRRRTCPSCGKISRR